MNYNKKLGITMQDIIDCDNVSQLFEWKTSLIMASSEIKNKILSEFGENNVNKFRDNERFMKLYDANRYTKQMIQVTASRIDMFRTEHELSLEERYNKLLSIVEGTVSKRKWRKINEKLS